VEGVELQEGAVERRHQLDVGEGAFLVGVEARRLGGDDREEDAPAPRRVRGGGAARRREADRHQEGEGCFQTAPPTASNRRRHCRSPASAWISPRPGGARRRRRPLDPADATRRAAGVSNERSGERTAHGIRTKTTSKLLARAAWKYTPESWSRS